MCYVTNPLTGGPVGITIEVQESSPRVELTLKEGQLISRRNFDD
jgi:hypothetical protein